MRKNRKRNITWFNPPYSKNVKTRFGEKFFKLIRKHFPPGHKLNKIFNKNTVKVSDSCMKSMNNIMKSHNDGVIRTHNQIPDPKDKGHATVGKKKIVH